MLFLFIDVLKLGKLTPDAENAAGHHRTPQEPRRKCEKAKKNE
jgi:hypothetical protein